jgi:hypothetical protein
LNDGVDGFVENHVYRKDSAQTFLSHGGEVQKVLQLKLNELIAQFSGNLIVNGRSFIASFLV